MLVAALSFVWLLLLPVDFAYGQFAVALLLNGLGMGLFASPNRAGIMNSLPAAQRGVGAGHDGHLPERRDGAVDRHLLLADGHRAGASLPQTLTHGLTAQGVPPDAGGARSRTCRR